LSRQQVLAEEKALRRILLATEAMAGHLQPQAGHLELEVLLEQILMEMRLMALAEIQLSEVAAEAVGVEQV
jgi:hypothetical protein